MAWTWANKLYSNLTANISASDTSVTVASIGDLTLAAGETCLATLQRGDMSAHEIVLITAAAGNTLTITRAQSGTTAQNWTTTDLLVGGVYRTQLRGFAAKREPWFVATSDAIDIANGSKQKRTLTANATLSFTLNDGDDLTLILNPATYTATFPAITWFGSAPVLTASKEHTIVISKDGSVLRGWWQVAA